MSTNNMNMVDRLAEKLKTSDLGDWITEQDVAEISRDAIKQAFFQNRQTGDYHNRTLPPFLVEVASKVFEDAMREQMKVVAEQLSKEPEFADLVERAVLSGIEQRIKNFGPMLVETILMERAGLTLEALQRSVQLSLQIVRG